MIRRYPCLLILFATLSILLPTPSPAADIKPMRTVTPNGMTVLVLDSPSVPIVHINVLVKAGAVFDPDSKAGLANLTAQLLDEGTTTRSATQIAQEIEFVGGELSTAAGEDFATATVRVLKKDMDLGFTLLADILLNPAFAEKEIARVRSQTLGEIQGQKDEPGVVADKAFDEIVFKGHPYHKPSIGTEETLPRITKKDLVEFYDTHYRPNHTVIAIVGDIREFEALDLINKHFGKWARKDDASPTFPPPAPLQQPVLKLIDKDLTQANVILGHVGIDRRNPDFYAVSVMNYILGGGGFSSRLVNRIRDEQGLAYDVDSGFEATVMPGPFTVRLQTRNSTANQAITGVLAEMKRIRTDPVADHELADAKAYLIGSFPLRLDTTAKMAALLNLIELHGLGLSYFQDYPKALAVVTKDDVLRVAEKYLHPDKYVLVVVGKQSEAKIDQEAFLGHK